LCPVETVLGLNGRAVFQPNSNWRASPCFPLNVWFISKAFPLSTSRKAVDGDLFEESQTLTQLLVDRRYAKVNKFKSAYTIDIREYYEVSSLLSNQCTTLLKLQHNPARF